MQKCSYFLCSVEFVPVIGKENRSRTVRNSNEDKFIIELTVNSGNECEIYETGEHKVFRTFDWRCVFFNEDFCKAVKWDQNSDLL